MSFLIIDQERYALQLGETTLGGDSDEALALSALAKLSPFAVITSAVDETASIRPLRGVGTIKVGGEPLTAEPRTLRHGDRIEVGPVTLYFGEVRAMGATSPVRGVTDEQARLLDEFATADATAGTGGRLVSLRDGRRHDVPAEGLVIGRDPECGLVIPSGQTSRRHAVIEAGLLGYTITDRSTNGVYVNGARVQGLRLLRQDDVVRIGDVELRFEADPADFEPAPALRPAESPGAAPVAAPKRAPAPPAVLLAVLEVVSRGASEGQRIRIERPVVQLGRGSHNDIRLADDSVSGSHATLMRRGGAWHLLDLGSRNGSYVDGERVTEKELAQVCELRLGNVKMTFRAIAGSAADESATRAIVGITDDQLRARRTR